MAARYELPTNEWLPADGNKPWKDRKVGREKFIEWVKEGLELKQMKERMKGGE